MFLHQDFHSLWSASRYSRIAQRYLTLQVFGNMGRRYVQVFWRICLYLKIVIITTDLTLNVLPSKYMLIRPVKYFKFKRIDICLIQDMFTFIKPTLLFIDMYTHLFNIQDFYFFLILVNISSLLILYIKPKIKGEPCICDKGTGNIMNSSILIAKSLSLS